MGECREVIEFPPKILPLFSSERDEQKPRNADRAQELANPVRAFAVEKHEAGNSRQQKETWDQVGIFHFGPLRAS